MIEVRCHFPCRVNFESTKFPLGIRKAAEWYSQHISNHGQGYSRHPIVLLLTEDVANRQKAQKDGIPAMSLREYVHGMRDGTQLLDLLAAEGPDAAEPPNTRKVLYPEARFFKLGKLYCNLQF